MKIITIKSFAKINLTLDVKGLRQDGYHEIETVMQQLDLHDEVQVSWQPREERKPASGDERSVLIELKTDKFYLPTDSGNLAYRAAALMAERYAADLIGGKIFIEIKKNIPVAAGLAGGSGNAAAVLLALNRLWELNLGLETLCALGAEMGSDIPFCVMGQAKRNPNLGSQLGKDPKAATCAVGSGTGTELAPAVPLEAFVVLSKPPIRVSTSEVYRGIDRELESLAAEGRPVAPLDSQKLIAALREKDYGTLAGLMGNSLEYFTLKKYPVVRETKDRLQGCGRPVKVLMSGSGPTVFAIYTDKDEAKKGFLELSKINKETYLTRTIV